MQYVRIEDGAATVSTQAPAERTMHAASFATALVEARGAHLSWDVTSGDRFPDAEISDVLSAGAWLDQVYGPNVADAVRAGAAEPIVLALPESAELVDKARRLAHVNWARAWWPAGATVPALDPALLAAEMALLSSSLEHVLDDDEAVERALFDAEDALTALAAVSEALAAEAARVAEALTELADTYGVELAPTDVPTSTRREEWALAAGGHDLGGSGFEVASGTAQVRWADVPAQTVAADADARWSLRQESGVTTLHATVPAAPKSIRAAAIRPDAEHGSRALSEDTSSAPKTNRVVATGIPVLTARFGPESVGIDIPLQHDGAGFTGTAEVPASALFLPAAVRTLWVRDPLMGVEPGAPESVDLRARVRDLAAAHLDLPTASLAERAAGVRR